MKKKPKIGCIIPVRYDSERLPGKIIEKTLNNIPNFMCIVDRIRQSKMVNVIILAVIADGITMNMIEGEIHNIWEYNEDYELPESGETPLVYYKAKKDEAENVMKRTLSAAKAHDIDIIVDITADCPFVDPGLIDCLCSSFLSMTKPIVNYVSNIFPTRSFPDGFDIQVYSTKSYTKANKLVKDSKLKLHTGWNIPILYQEGKLDIHWKNMLAEHPYDRPEIGMTLDTPEDLVLVRKVYDFFQHNNFGYKEAIDYVLHEKLYLINRHVRRKQPEEG